MDTFIQLARDSGLANISLGNLGMFVIAGILIYLAITKEYEPLLLIPIGFGAILANLPMANMGSYGDGIIALIYDSGIRTELLPPLIFLGVGAGKLFFGDMAGSSSAGLPTTLSTLTPY